MRIFKYILTILTALMLVVSSGAGDFCSELCLEAIDQEQLAVQDCACASSHASDTVAGEYFTAQLNALNLSGENCDLCVEIPVGNEDEPFIHSKTSKVKTVAFSTASSLTPNDVHDSLRPSSNVPHFRSSWLSMGALPLLI